MRMSGIARCVRRVRGGEIDGGAVSADECWQPVPYQRVRSRHTSLPRFSRDKRKVDLDATLRRTALALQQYRDGNKLL